ncbi:SAM-dependent methyltransferase [Amycolatopsis sp. FBCC-B4732]|uniref:class I SAM-dependent methyltransferase n=1 Tax=Amycolatopsis sp. FBCC-B4732 TaxID=3079339 RepID=UPI001FF26487|nr:SAM-dependent methyltransferase [Amycolatopsis sp. FBCC-B4732]UOX93155.1 SAM-dependent methyltransferase [Amycolatopsis sp. FBCC-B4732]
MPTISTAESVTLLRAAGALQPERELRNPDLLASRVLPWWPPLPALIKVPGIRLLISRAIRKKHAAGMWYEVIRTKYMDDVLSASTAAGASQVVLLGAGFDSRVHRLRKALGTASVFEVDQPHMSARKQECVRTLPEHGVRYVTVDLEKEDLDGVLQSAGFDQTLRTVVLWSGVTPYLRAESVETTLRWFARLAPGSSLVFDYCWQEILDGTAVIPEAQAILRQVAARGEPWRWGIRRGRAEELLAAHRLHLVEDLEAAAAQRRYLTRPDGSVQGPIWFFGGFVHAQVPRSRH